MTDARVYSNEDLAGKLIQALEGIAKQHNTTVPELVKSAQSAGSAGLPYLIRTLNLVARLEGLEQ